MTASDFLIMRHELLITAAIVITLLAEIFSAKRKQLSFLPVMLFALVLIVGFMPAPNGELFGGMYVNDNLRILMKNILNTGVFIILLQSLNWLSENQNDGKRSEFFILMFSTLAGMNFMISSGDFLMFYLGIELSAIPLAAMAAWDKYKNQSAEAGIKMILSSAFSSGVMLFGISMLYGSTGTLYFSEVALLLDGNAMQLLGFIFFISGIAFKISLVPFHFWTPDVYEGSPISVTSYFSVISKGSAVFIFVILLFSVFSDMIRQWQPIIISIAVMTMTIGNLFAIRQQNFKRFLAYSSIAQAGFILLGFVGGEQSGMASVIYFVPVYILSNLAAFGVVSIISDKTGKENINDYDGLYKTNPKLSLALMLALFSLAGIPPLAGFFGKFFLFSSAASAGFYWLLFIAVINATISLYYYLLPVKAMFINKNENAIVHFISNKPARIALVICVTGLIMLGIAGELFDYINSLSFGI
jgi:NADH-quinone oxidoreductase subunit N